MVDVKGSSGPERGFLHRLLHDRRGNTLAMMAAMMVPLAGLAGSAIDIGRMHVVKVRLQQACDAGVLAGRKVLPASDSRTLDKKAEDQADAFFANNFPTDWMGTSATEFTPVKTTDNQVAGTASTLVPMTVMKMFGSPARTLSVSCKAEFDLPDTDVMFVLDTTGSMACLPSHDTAQCSAYVNSNAAVALSRPAAGTQPGYAVTAGYAGSTAYGVPEASGSRIAELRKAVQTFYATMKSQSDPETKVRYGFVPYASSVNPGQAILNVAPAMLRGTTQSGVATAPYQSRRVTGEYQTNLYSGVGPETRSQDCSTIARFRLPQPTQAQPFIFDANQRANYYTRSWRNNRCEYSEVQEVGPVWTHQRVDHDVTGFVAGGVVDDPSKLTSAQSRWAGCIEEREGLAATLSYDWQDLPADLDPDLVPGTAAQRWTPYWPDVVYNRPYDSGNGTVQAQQNVNGDRDSNSFNNFAPIMRDAWQKGGFVTCGKPVQRLAEMTAQQITDYVTAADFVPHGGTYHDAGMIWGARMLSADGPFKADTAAWPGRTEPKRVLVFLTDGDMSPGYNGYTFKGVEVLDKRVSGSGLDLDDLKDWHNARFLAVCDWARNNPNQIDVWTVSITTAKTPNAQLTACARTPAQAFATAGEAGKLESIFAQIARQVASLRISQ